MPLTCKVRLRTHNRKAVSVAGDKTCGAGERWAYSAARQAQCLDTSAWSPYSLRKMLGRNSLALAIAGALMFPAISACLTSAADARAMQCCTHLTCAPGHLKPACFSTTAPADSSQSGPEVRTSLAAPLVAATADFYPVPEEIRTAAFSSAGAAEAPQHSPPELYTLHLALLI